MCKVLNLFMVLIVADLFNLVFANPKNSNQYMRLKVKHASLFSPIALKNSKVIAIGGYEQKASKKGTKSTIELKVNVKHPEGVFLILNTYKNISWRIYSDSPITGIVVSNVHKESPQIWSNKKSNVWQMPLKDFYKLDYRYRVFQKQLYNQTGVNRIDKVFAEYALRSKIHIKALNRNSPYLRLNGIKGQRPPFNLQFTLFAENRVRIPWLLKKPLNKKSWGGKEGSLIETEDVVLHSRKMAFDRYQGTNFRTSDDYILMLPRKGPSKIIRIPKHGSLYHARDLVYNSRKKELVLFYSSGGAFFRKYDLKSDSFSKVKKLKYFSLDSVFYCEEVDRFFAWGSDEDLLTLSTDGVILQKILLKNRLPYKEYLMKDSGIQATYLVRSKNGYEFAIIGVIENKVAAIWAYSKKTNDVVLTYVGKLDQKHIPSRLEVLGVRIHD